ncbi:ATP-binding protein [Nocardiopsis suaedae]|uniref:ATP-binding protein n=1 Tax=Nocardiopsis suaedae TaxID=3018444 RepID=A0ABT4TNL3_9ACTN|nr:ATP-binding protein [Nocardiopsis suaedae]MDA2806278.1 ATP-binding protein [Nocardiopsis suaedae]
MSTVVPRPSTTHPGQGWGPALDRIALAGTPDASAELRVWAARRLTGCPRPYRNDSDLRDRLELVASELASNAVRHSASGRDGGFMVAALFTPHDRVALRLYDEGPRRELPTRPAPPPPELDALDMHAAESGRGIALVALSSIGYGFTAPPEQSAYSVWAEFAPSTRSADAGERWF